MIPVFLCPDNSGQTDDEKDMILQYKGWCNAYKKILKNKGKCNNQASTDCRGH